MGNSPSNTIHGQPQYMNRLLEQDIKKRKNEVKVALLGYSGSGKSTTVKKMRALYQSGLSNQERMLYIPIIRRNLLDGVKVILDILDLVDSDPELVPEELAWESGKWFLERNLVASYLLQPIGTDQLSLVDSSVTCFDALTEREVSTLCEGEDPVQVGQAIETIWADPVVQGLVKAMGSVAAEQDIPPLMFNASFFLATAARVLAVDYLPETRDILLSRNKSTEVEEANFAIGSLSIHLYEICAQWLPQPKWLQRLSGVTSIIFCSALSDYDQMVEEREGQTRIHESLDMFKAIIQSPPFLCTSIILILSKIDLFKKKLRNTPLNSFFPEYTGGDDVKKGVKFIWRKYSQTIKQYDKARIVYPHVMQLSDSGTLKRVIVALEETISLENLYGSGRGRP